MGNINQDFLTDHILDSTLTEQTTTVTEIALPTPITSTVEVIESTNTLSPTNGLTSELKPNVSLVSVMGGIQGAKGPKGDKGDTGAPGNAFLRTQFVQDTPLALWYIEHNLGFRPSVRVYDTAGTEFLVAVTHLDDNILTITFGRPFSGIAHLI